MKFSCFLLNFQILEGCPIWLKRYIGQVVEYINAERSLLPLEMMKNPTFAYDEHTADAEAQGYFLSRLQNLAISVVCMFSCFADTTQDVIKYILRTSRAQVPPFKIVPASQVVEHLWNAEFSLKTQLLV
jgi:hypothetical protein